MLERQKEIVVEVGKYLFERGFTQLSGGNISVRDPQTNLVAIKPSGVHHASVRSKPRFASHAFLRVSATSAMHAIAANSEPMATMI